MHPYLLKTCFLSVSGTHLCRKKIGKNLKICPLVINFSQYRKTLSKNWRVTDSQKFWISNELFKLWETNEFRAVMTFNTHKNTKLLLNPTKVKTTAALQVLIEVVQHAGLKNNRTQIHISMWMSVQIQIIIN